MKDASATQSGSRLLWLLGLVVGVGGVTERSRWVARVVRGRARAEPGCRL